MKRIWFAILFLALSVGLCVGEQMYSKKVYNDINSIIAEYDENGNNEDKSRTVNRIKDYWDKHNDLLFTIEESEALNELGQAISGLDPDDKDIPKSLNEIKTINKFFYENQRITAANIF